MAALSGLAFMYNGVVEVAYEGFGPSIVKLVGILLLAVWAFIIAGVYHGRLDVAQRAPRVHPCGG